MKIISFPSLLKYHVALGILLNFIPQLFIIHVYVFLILYVYLLFSNLGNNRQFRHLFLFGFLYFPFCESVGRLHSLDPFVPWELGKYISIFLVFVLILSRNFIFGWRAFLGILLIITTLINGNTEWKLVFFNASVAYCILILGDFFRHIKMQFPKLLLYLRFSILPLITFLFSSLFKIKFALSNKVNNCLAPSFLLQSEQHETL